MVTTDQQEAVRRALRSWQRRATSIAADRDPLIYTAVIKAELTKEEVHVLTGLGRTTIDRIVAKGAPS